MESRRLADALAIEEAVAASIAGDTDRIDAWLRHGGDPNQYDAQGWTPLLAGAVRGREGVVATLLGNRWAPANPDIPHRVSGALAIHFAGHSGSVAVSERLLARRAEHLDAIWDINGHTLLLQAAFYGHLELAAYALKRGANAAATTVRGLAALELAQQFQNQGLIDLIRPFDAPESAKKAWYAALLKRIELTTPPEESAAQAAADSLLEVIASGLASAATSASSVGATLAQVGRLVEHGADVNRLGGPLLQPPLTAVVTGNNGSPANEDVARLRLNLAEYLLERGADPTRLERHPMGVDAFIRAAVFNHLGILKMMGRRVTAERLAQALNARPIVNGLTALHDTVLRGSTAGPERLEGYLDQIRWFVANGARSDIEDFSGRTQRSIAERTSNPETRARLLEALGG